MSIRAEDILTGLGGSGNVLEIEPCVTRLRAQVADPGLLDADRLRLFGCHGVLLRGRNHVQIVVGPRADVLAAELEALAWPSGGRDVLEQRRVV